MKKIVLFLFCWFLLLCLWSEEYIIRTKMANLRKLPNSQSGIITKLYQYESIKVIDRKGKWIKVKSLEGYVGWVHENVIEKVEDEKDKRTQTTSINKINHSQSLYQTQSQTTTFSSFPVIILQLDNQNTTNKSLNTSNLSNSPNSSLDKNLLREKVSDYNRNKRRRVIGEHIFPTTVLFPSPIPSARFGFSQGFLTKRGEYVSVSDDNEDGIIQSTEITKNKYNYAGLSEIFDTGIVVHENIAFDLNANILLSGGMEKKDFTSIEATPGGEVRIGPNFSYKLDNNLLISFGLKYYLHKGVNISASYGIGGMIDVLEEKLGNDEGFLEFFNSVAAMSPEDGGGDDPEKIDSIDEWMNLIASTYTKTFLKDAIEGFTKNIVVDNTKSAISPFLGFAYPITKYLGVQGIVEYQKIKDKYSTKMQGLEVSYGKLNYGLATSVDFRHLIKFPLGLSLEYFREKYELEKTNSFAFSTYYQGIGDVQLGLILKFAETIIKESEITYKNTYKQRLIQFTIAYFF